MTQEKLDHLFALLAVGEKPAAKKEYGNDVSQSELDGMFQEYSLEKDKPQEAPSTPAWLQEEIKRAYVKGARRHPMTGGCASELSPTEEHLNSLLES